jgi:hypothetical protein
MKFVHEKSVKSLHSVDSQWKHYVAPILGLSCGDRPVFLTGDGNRSFAEALHASSRGTDTTCEMNNMSPTQTHEKRNVIRVKNEVEIKLSARKEAAHT